jgi:hypothetical protein
MTVSDFSAAHQDGIGPLFKTLQDMLNIDVPGTKIFDNPDIGWILQPHGTGHISSRIGAIGTNQGDYFRFKGGHKKPLFVTRSSFVEKCKNN